MLEGRAVNRLANGVKVGIRSIQKNHAPAGKQSRKETGKSAAQCLASAIGVAQDLYHIGSAKRITGSSDFRFDFRSEMDGPHRSIPHAPTGNCEFLQRSFWTQQRSVVHLGQVVVLGG